MKADCAVCFHRLFPWTVSIDCFRVLFPDAKKGMCECEEAEAEAEAESEAEAEADAEAETEAEALFDFRLNMSDWFMSVSGFEALVCCSDCVLGWVQSEKQGME